MVKNALKTELRSYTPTSSDYLSELIAKLLGDSRSDREMAIAGPRISRFLNRPNVTWNVTHEAIPAASSNHVPKILNALLEDKKRYTSEGSCTPNGKDILYDGH